MRCFDVNYNGEFCYEIYFSDSFFDLGAELSKVQASWNKVCIVTDSNVAPLYLQELISTLEKTSIFSHITSFTIPAGEEYKTLDVVQDLYSHLVEEHLDRKDLLIALGGGVVGDMTGFTAATYLRGIDFVQVPTTLLSQVDSSVGGKTGVDFRGFKNMVGAFYMPRLVYMNRKLLLSLPAEQLRSGLGEVIKYGIIRDSHLFEWLSENVDQILSMEEDALEYISFESCKIKKAVVEEDPKENGIRAILNFGHTIGHAIEKQMNFQMFHGECVGIGSCAASYMAHKRGLITEGEYQSVIMLHQRFGMPTRIPEEFRNNIQAEDILKTTKSDKKMLAGQIRFVLMNSIGNAILVNDVTDEEIIEAIGSVL